MFYFEAKKILFNKTVIILIVIACLINVFKIMIDTKNDTEMLEENIYQASLDLDSINGFSGSLNETTWKEIKTHRDIYFETLHNGGEYNPYDFMCKLICDRYDYQYHYDTNITHIIEKAHDNRLFYENKSKYLAHKNRLIENNYSDRRIESFLIGEGVRFLFKYKFSSLVLLILLMLVCERVFLEDKMSGMEILHKTNYFSRKRIFAYKMVVFFMSVILIEGILTFVDIITFSYRVSLQGWNNKLYAISKYQYCFLDISIGGYYILLVSCRLLGGLLIGGIFLFVGIVVNQKPSYYLINCILVALGIVFTEMTSVLDYAILLFQPLQLFYIDEKMTTLHTMNLFDYAVPSIYALIGFSICLLGLLYLYINKHYSKKV